MNFHQARDELLDALRPPGAPLKRFAHWDAQPPPLHGCILVVHPVENETDLLQVHGSILRDAIAQEELLLGRSRPVELLLGLRGGRARCAGRLIGRRVPKRSSRSVGSKHRR